MKINYLGIIKDQFKYDIELNGHQFDYSTGLGWIKTSNGVIKGFDKCLADLNDGGKSFSEIADIIEKNWETL